MDKIFKELLKKLRGIGFVVIGTVNMKLQGIDVESNDIDLATDDESMEKIAKIFSSIIIEERGFKETEFIIDHSQIHVVSVSTNPLRNDDFKKPVNIKKWNLQITGMPLESELEFYQKLNTLKPDKK